MDVEIPRRYGIEQCVGDTLGPGGVLGIRRKSRAEELPCRARRMRLAVCRIDPSGPLVRQAVGALEVDLEGRGRGSRRLAPPVCYQRSGRLDSMRVQGILKPRSSLSGPRSPSTCSSATKAFEAPLRTCSRCG
jgi:hypothetical protein